MEYKVYELNELLPYEQPQAYIVESTQYSDAYKTPVLTAGKSFVLGYTNETNGIFEEVPVIIFDDFTTATQFVNFKFKVKSSAMKILHINTELVLPKYIFYKLQTIHIDHSTHKRYWIQQFSKIKVKIPAISEQQRIVSRIEELFSSLDNAVETLQKTKEQLEVYRQAVLKAAFERKYTPDVIMHEITMEEIADGKDGLRRGPFGSAIKKAFFVDSGYKVYEQGNAIYDDCKRGHYFISEEKYNELSSFQLRPGDFIVSCSGTIGKIARLPVDAEAGVINQALMRIRLKPEVIDPYYFMLQFRSEVFQRRIISRGSGMGNLAGIKEFKAATMFIPDDYRNQKHIVDEIESRMSACDSIEQTVNTALLQSEAMRQCILKEAFEGKLS